MPLAAITAKAIPATANAPTMNQRVRRRILSDSFIFACLLSDER
jgi:hypothetical protein